MNRKEIQKISLQYRTLSSQMLKMNSQEEMYCIQQFFDFISETEIIRNYINECKTQEYDFEQIFADKGWRNVLMLPAKQEELVSYGYQLLQYILDGPKSLTIAVERCAFNDEKKLAISLGMAILDNWFELNNEDYHDIRNQIVGDKIVRIVNDRERLYREYFLLYNDQMAKDTIRVYYPKNGENWIRWDRDCSVDVKVNLSRGTEYGFCRIGFSYSRIEEQDFEKSLKVAYVNEDREIFRFEHDDMLNIDDKKILWAW